MKKANLIKLSIIAAALAIGFAGFGFTRKSELQTVDALKTPEIILDGKSAVAGYKSWTKVNEKPEIMDFEVSALCAQLKREPAETTTKNPHSDRFINVYVNSVGRDEMLTKANPKFPVGTVIVKEKLFSAVGDKTPELLTVMIKREKGFNPEVGDWEFMVLNGEATEVKAQGKMQNCQACHLGYEKNDFITRTYLPDGIRQKLK
ncbi:MAG TPA: cytochrome P460 family protein [Pyrinomonadaceae bacterium]